MLLCISCKLPPYAFYKIQAIYNKLFAKGCQYQLKKKKTRTNILMQASMGRHIKAPTLKSDDLNKFPPILLSTAKEVATH